MGDELTPAQRIIQGAKEAAQIARGETQPARATFFFAEPIYSADTEKPQSANDADPPS